MSGRYALAASLLLHAALFFVLRAALTPPPVERPAAMAVHDRVMQLRFIAVSLHTRPANAAPKMPATSPVRRPHVERATASPPAAPPQRHDATFVPMRAPTAEVPDDRGAVDRSGAAPAPIGEAVGDAGYTPPGVVGTPGVMDHKPAMTYTRTRFEGAWAPRDESSVAGGLRRMGESTTFTKTVDLGHGVRVHCAIGVLGGGCGLGDAPSRAAAKDGDTRLSLPPAQSLATSQDDRTSAPGEADCVLAYRKDDRVLPGCASDTPLKAMDQEGAEQQRRARH